MFGFVPRSLAVVGIVGTLSFGMPVAAQADTSVTVLKFLANVATFGGVAGVGVKAAAPLVGEGFACAATAPLCAAVAVATVGAALYMTKDTWVPWIQGLSHLGEVSTPGWSAGLGYKVRLNDAGTSGTQVALDLERVVTEGEPYYITPAVVGTIYCATHTFNDIYHPVGVPDGQGQYGYYIRNNTGPSPFTTAWAGCSSYGPMVGFALAAEGATPGTITWGTQIPVAPGITTSTQVDCVNPDGSQYSVTSAVPLAGDLVKVPTCTGAPGDLGGAHGKCVTLSAANTGDPQVVQSSNCSVVAGSDLEYPDCAVSGCAYMVIVDGLPCTVGRPGCVDWARTYATTPGRVGCRYGEYAVKVSSCFFLERVYESVGTPVDGTLANTDGNPDTHTGDAPAPLPQPGTIPNGAPGGAPGTLPGGGTTPLPSPSGSPQTSADCWGSASFSWNPVDWVVTPVKCALAWAFVPTAIDTTPVTTQLDRAGVAPSIAALSTAVGSLGGTEGGCSGPSVSFDVGSVHQVVTPFAACTAPMSTVAGYAYAFISVVTVLGGAGKIISSIGAGFGFGGPPPTWQQGTLF